MRRGKHPGPADLILPRAGQPGRFMNMPVQGNERLALFNKTPDGNAAHIYVQRHMIDHFPAKRRAIQF